MKQLAPVVFGWLLTVATSYVLGRLLMHLLRLRVSRQERHAYGFLAGSVLLSTVTFGLTAAGLAHKGIFLGVALLALSAAGWQRALSGDAPSLPPMSRAWWALFWVVYLPYAGLYLVHALAPETSPDGVSYHLGHVARYVEEGGFPRETTSFYQSLSQGMEMLYLFAFAWGRHSAATLVHLSFLLLVPWLALCWGRRAGEPGAGVVGGLLVYASPIAGVTGTTSYNEMGLVAALLGVFGLLHVWEREAHPEGGKAGRPGEDGPAAKAVGGPVPVRRAAGDAYLAVVGLLAGFAFAVKFTAFLAPVYAAGFVLWRKRREGGLRLALRPLALLLGGFALVALPWLGKSWVLTGNPLSPFFNRLFPNPYIQVELEEGLRQQMRHYNTIRHWTEIPRAVTLEGHKLEGTLGPVFLLAPLALLSLRTLAGRRLLLAALLFALPYPSNVGTRFLLPTACFAALALGVAVSRWVGVAAPVVLAHAVLSWPTVLPLHVHQYAYRLPPEAPVQAAFRLVPEEMYLAQRLGDYGLAELVNEFVPRGGRVLSMGGFPRAYTAREVLVSWEGVLPLRLRHQLHTAYDQGVQPIRILTFRFPAQAVRRFRVVQTVTERHTPVINEVLVASPDGPIAPDAAWRATASPFPWGAHLALDGNATTRWSAWERQRPGLWWQLDFGRARALSEVRLQLPYDQWFVRYEIQVEGRNGWVVASSSPATSYLPSPLALRHAAAVSLRQAGVPYLLLRDDDPGAGDARDHLAEYGFAVVARRAGATLYRAP